MRNKLAGIVDVHGPREDCVVEDVDSNKKCTLHNENSVSVPCTADRPYFVRCEIVGHENEAPSSTPRAAQGTQDLESDLRGQWA